MDRILKENFDSFRQRDEMPPELKELSGMRLFADIKLLNEWRNNRKGISHESNGVMFRGAVDDMLSNGGKLAVLDFKTRGYPLKEDTHEHYRGQLDSYTYLLERNGFEAEHYGYLLFYYPDKVVGNGISMFETRLVKVDTDPSRAEKKLNDAVACIKSSEPPKASAGCEYCKYSETRKRSI